MDQAVPVIPDEPGPARNSAASATSCTVLSRPSAVLLDGLARTPALVPGPDGAQRVAVPRRIARIDLYTELGDSDLATAHPQGILLTHDLPTGDCTAHTPAGQPIARITGMDLAPPAVLPTAAPSAALSAALSAEVRQPLT